MKPVLLWYLAVFAAVTLLAGQARTDSRSGVTLRVHLIASCGSARATAPMQLAATSEHYCLQEPAVAEEKDVASARYDEHAHDKSTIDVILQPEAARRMLDVTRKNIGLKVGVVINGQLLSVAMIAAGTAHVWIAGLPQNTAESLIGAFQRLHRER